jgi:hypothetical protein
MEPSSRRFTFDWPDGLSRDDIGDNRDPRGEAIKALIGLAEKCARLVLPLDFSVKPVDGILLAKFD